MATRQRNQFDVIVIGAGLGGLSAGLALQQQGLRVAIVERLERAGGLCGTCHHEGFEFVVACNDFGAAMESQLKSLGVAASFARTRTLVHYAGRRYALPLDWQTVASLLPRLGELRRYYTGLRQAWRGDQALSTDLEALVDGTVRNPRLNDLLKLPAYLMGVGPHQIGAEVLRHDFEFGYGYRKPLAPVGGPGCVAQAMASRFEEGGGTLRLGAECKGTQHENGLKIVDTTKGPFRGRYAVNAAFGESAYPATFQRGLPISIYWLVVDKRFRYPEGVHSIVCYPPGISDWFRALDAGTLPEHFGFHVFKSDLPEKSDHYTMNLYFYLPRGVNDVDAGTAARVERYVFGELEHILPGITGAIRRKYLVSPSDFVRRHRLSGRVTPVILPPGFRKPDNYDPFSNTYYAGAAAFPPGGHAGAALRSGIEAARRILAVESSAFTRDAARSRALQEAVATETSA